MYQVIEYSDEYHGRKPTGRDNSKGMGDTGDSYLSPGYALHVELA